MVSLDSPLALYSIPAVLATVIYPQKRMIITIGKYGEWNNLAPRKSLDKLKESGKITLEFAAKLERMKYAHANGLETFPLWVAGLFAGLFAGLDNRLVNMHAITFVALRTLYNYIYINQRTKLHTSCRTIVYTASFAVPLSLIFRAAYALNSG
ncbi:hypothetical protein M378DRAFT_163621 [Amanita muscaria Koide BX008]|uniref:Uncharacterized protein n=1 Tax=Amanita muscaria (strain Koide BX008) TaxID=946122 RepID=A0A0C2X5Z5_AMAMK|nr:hypothetical protein M378DRAFT_163621 [Amanita muscaria Koide BX008]